MPVRPRTLRRHLLRVRRLTFPRVNRIAARISPGIRIGVAAMATLTSGCAGPAVTATLRRPPSGLPVERKWVISLPQRFQHTVWGGRMFMPDELVSRVVADGRRLLSVESQHVKSGFACRLRLVERDRSTGRTIRELPVDRDVPDDRRRCRLLDIGGRWYVAHPPWGPDSSSTGVLLPWPNASATTVGGDVVRTDLLPPEMAKRVEDEGCLSTDGRHLLVAAVIPRRATNDTRRWLAAACIDVETPKLVWAARAEIRSAIERYRDGVRVDRFGDVVVARGSTLMPRGKKRCREHFAAFRSDTGRLIWSRSAPARRQPPSFQLVADDTRLFVHAEDTVVEAWSLQTGGTMWRRDLGRVVVSDGTIRAGQLPGARSGPTPPGDGTLRAGQLIVFVGDDYPTPGTPTAAEPVAIPLDGQGTVSNPGGSIRAVLTPSFAVTPGWILTAPDDRLVAWPLAAGPPVGKQVPLEWQCWRLPGGLLPQDAVGTMMPLNDGGIVSHIRGTGTLTLLQLAR